MRRVIIITCYLTIVLFRCHETKECVDGSSRWYVGKISKTASGRTCQRWDVDEPHKPKHIPIDGPHHNYCRNPDDDLRATWCYTTDSAQRWEYCNISKCPDDDSLFIWTSYNSATTTTYLLAIHADPEVVHRMTHATGSFRETIMTSSNGSMTEYRALAAHYQKSLLYFTDYRSEYVAVWDMDKKQATKYFEGMARGIESLAFDWVTNNLYWTDSKFKWVMVSDDTFTHYSPVYRTSPAPAYGLAIHSTKRYLIFSTYETLGSKIIRTDLAGKNATTLFAYPNVFDVTGLAVDYTDDRLYWTDFTGYGGMIVSSRLDGSTKTQHHYRVGAIFWGVAPYMDYLYVTDVHVRYTTAGNRKYYSNWIIRKATNQVYSYNQTGKPNGVAVYSHNEEYSTDKSTEIGECNADFECDHICLPRINATRKCACSLGYHLYPLTNKCISRLVNDNYLLVVDAVQGKVFQIPIADIKDQKNESTYSIVPIGTIWNVSTVAVDHRQGYLYWSDEKKLSISRSAIDGSRYIKVASLYANSIIVDPHTGYLFYSDNERATIMVSRGDGMSTKTIVKPDPSANTPSSIRMIAQDIKYKYIYWTDTFSKEGQGKVMRCRYDGSGKEVVLENLNWPHAITIDYKTNRMYVAEAKDALIYEVELSSLKTINNTSPKQKKYKLYDISVYMSDASPYIIDLKIHQDMAYVVNRTNNRLRRFSLTEGAFSMAPFGPADFYRVTALSVYNETFYSTYIKPVNNPCKNRRCREICVALGDTESACLCQDGKIPIGSICIDDSVLASKDTRPPVPQNCPDDIEVTLRNCSEYVEPSWTPPTWQDETTAEGDLVITLPAISPRAKLTSGTVKLTYTARDQAGNTGYCSFVIKVIDNRCPAVPDVRPDMKRTKPTCENREGSVFTVSCIDEKHVISIPPLTSGEISQHRSYQVKCSKNLRWESSLLPASALCKPLTTLATTEESTRAEITPMSSTAAKQWTASPTTVTPTSSRKAKIRSNVVVNGQESIILRAIFCYIDDKPPNAPYSVERNQYTKN